MNKEIKMVEPNEMEESIAKFNQWVDTFEAAVKKKKQVAFKQGQSAFEDFETTPEANFPENPYQDYNELGKEWLKGFQYAANETGDFGICSDCGSKDIWYCEGIVWCNVVTHEEDEVYYEDPVIRCEKCLCDTCTDLSDFLDNLMYDLEN